MRVQMKVEFPLRYRLSETLITLLTINASTFGRYQLFVAIRQNRCYYFRGNSILLASIH